MSDGTEFSEATEAPQESKEVQESPEKQAEIKEAAEVQRATDEATVSPEAAVEKGDFQSAENLEEAFKAAFSPPEQTATTGAVTASPGIEISPASQEAPSRVESPRTAESNAAEYLQEAGQPEIQEAAETVPVSEQTEQAQSGAVPDLETVERDDGETTLVKDGGDDDQFDPDDGLEQAGDIREDTDISNQYGDGEIKTGDGVDTLRDPAQAGAGIDEIPDMIPDLGEFTPGEGGGMEPGDLGGPGTGLDQEGERGNLVGAAAFGADGRISNARDDVEYIANLQALGLDVDGSEALGDLMGESGSSMGGDEGMLTELAGKMVSGEELTKEEQEWVDKKAKETAEGKENSGSSSSVSSGGRTGIYRGPGTVGTGTGEGTDNPHYVLPNGAIHTPNPDGVENEEFDESLDGKLRAQAFSNLSSVDQELGDEAVSQPVDEDGASPKEPGIAFDRETQTDPYSQDSVDGADTPSTGFIPDEKSKFTPGMAGGDDGVLDPDFGVVDPDKPTGENSAGGDEGSLPNKPD